MERNRRSAHHPLLVLMLVLVTAILAHGSDLVGKHVSPTLSDMESSLLTIDSATVEVRDFCTANIGATDDTECAQKAIDRAGSNGGGASAFCSWNVFVQGHAQS
jgi:hypothetical protein